MGPIVSNVVKPTPSPNAFRKFAYVRFLLYMSREIGTYTGDVDTFPDSQSRRARSADRVSRRVGSPDRRGRPADRAAPAWPQAARAIDRPAACAYLSRHARRRDLGRSFLPIVRGAVRRQFLGRSAGPSALGRLCRPDAARVAAEGYPPPSRGVLAGLAAGGARWDAIQSDQHAADHGDGRESEDAAAARRSPRSRPPCSWSLACTIPWPP